MGYNLNTRITNVKRKSESVKIELMEILINSVHQLQENNTNYLTRLWVEFDSHQKTEFREWLKKWDVLAFIRWDGKKEKIAFKKGKDKDFSLFNEWVDDMGEHVTFGDGHYKTDISLYSLTDSDKKEIQFNEIDTLWNAVKALQKLAERGYDVKDAVNKASLGLGYTKKEFKDVVKTVRKDDKKSMPAYVPESETSVAAMVH